MKILLSVALALTSASALAKSTVCDSYSTPKEYTKATQAIAEDIKALSAKPIVAKQADTVLSTLVAAKSPVITSWINKPEHAKLTEDEIAKEWRRYYANVFILSKYPSGDAATDAETEKLVDGIIARELTPKFREGLEKNFEQAKKNALATLDSWKLANVVKIRERVNGITLYWPKNLKTARNNAIPLDIIDWGIAYDPTANQINVGVGALVYPNDESLRSVFAHELGHSFDSCRWGAFFEGKWPFEKVGACLRDEKSVGARKRDDSAMEKMVASGRLDSKIKMALEMSPTCNKLAYPPIGVQADQLPEAFADWFSAEVMSREEKLDRSKLRLDLCAIKETKSTSSYPDNDSRMTKIYFAHPKFRTDPKIPYCSLD